MNTGGDICALLLAAGEGRRYGRLKQLETLDGISLLQRAARAALDSALELFVVSGAGADDVHAELCGWPVQLVHNPHWQRGMGSSIACGVRAVRQQRPLASALMILLADQALIHAGEVQAMLAMHRAQPTRLIAADHGKAFGPPCVFPSDCFDALAQLDGEAGAKRVLEQHRERLMRIAMPAAAFDVDTPDDLARLIEHSRQP